MLLFFFFFFPHEQLRCCFKALSLLAALLQSDEAQGYHIKAIYIRWDWLDLGSLRARAGRRRAMLSFI